MDKATRSPNPKILAWAAVLVIIILLVGSLSITTKALLIIAISIIFLFVSKSDLSSLGFGLYMLRSKVGIKSIDKIAKKNKNFWNAFADWGLTVSLGLLAYPLFKKSMDKRMFVLGMLTIVAIFFVVIPASIIPVQFINLPQIQDKLATSLSCVSQSTLQAPNASALFSPQLLLMFIVFLVGGLAFLIPMLLFLNAFGIIIAAASSVHFVGGTYNYSGAYNAINSQVPGAAPIIPGITIPFFAGIISLIIILVIHEFSHGILARISKIKIKNTGLLFLLGVIPIGAFVEPDESKIAKLGSVEQNRISIAGVSANLLATIIFLVIMAIFANYIIPSISTSNILIYVVGGPGYPAYNVIVPGSFLLGIDNHSISNLSEVSAAESSIAPMSTINVLTSKGDYNIQTNSHGKIGVYLCQSSVVSSANPLNSVLEFLFVLVALLFLLNFSIAAVNLLPVPGFDGWRIYNMELKDHLKLLYLIELAVLAAILINVLPLLTYVASIL